MPTRQPTWKLIRNLGDKNPFDHGGYFIYQDETGVYPEEGEYLVEPEEEGGVYTIYRFTVDKLKVVVHEETHISYLVSDQYESGWSHPLHRYDEWFHEDLHKVAEVHGLDYKDLRDLFCSDDPLMRAEGYRAIGDYHGFLNLDAYPLTFTDREEVEARYAKK